MKKESVPKSKTNKKKSKTLKDIWEDFILYDSIIDSYISNFWGTENLCKKVRIEYDGNPKNINLYRIFMTFSYKYKICLIIFCAKIRLFSKTTKCFSLFYG